MERMKIRIKKNVFLPEYQKDRDYYVISTKIIFDIEKFPFIHREYKTYQGDHKYPVYHYYGCEIEKVL